MKRWQTGWLAAVALAGAVQAAPPAGKKPAAAGKVKIRPKYVEGRAWGYQLKLSGATAWAPAAKGLQWGKMTTDFTFVLLPKASSGTYKASGEASWDVAAGALYSATANQKILIKADRPTPRVLRSVADCSLKLLKTKSVPPGRKPA